PEDVMAWTDFLDFLRRYDIAAKAFRTGEDYAEVVADYLTRCRDGGAIYVELTCSPDHARNQGIPPDEHLAGVAAGIDAVDGIDARMVLTGLRHLGPEAVLRTARYAASRPHPYVVGFNLAGDEAGFPADLFHDAFAVAHDAGLGITCHAGEWDGPASVRRALALPGVTRIGHGVRAIEDPALVAELAERGTVLEVCPTSNVVLGAFTWETHPLRALFDAGVKVTLGSDDPPWFGATLAGEHAAARDRFGFGEDELREVSRTAVEAAFCEEPLRQALRARL
ncbi:MAG: adenosine deaminase, partial [Acidimicrobiia bacterium]